LKFCQTGAQVKGLIDHMPATSVHDAMLGRPIKIDPLAAALFKAKSVWGKEVKASGFSNVQVFSVGLEKSAALGEFPFL
jgi:hypothetical protein